MKLVIELDLDNDDFLVESDGEDRIAMYDVASAINTALARFGNNIPILSGSSSESINDSDGVIVGWITIS